MDVSKVLEEMVAKAVESATLARKCAGEAWDRTSHDSSSKASAEAARAFDYAASAAFSAARATRLAMGGAEGGGAVGNDSYEDAFCLAEGHKHASREEEAICSLRWQLAQARVKIENLRAVIVAEAGHAPDCPVVSGASVDCAGGVPCPNPDLAQAEKAEAEPEKVPDWLSMKSLEARIAKLEDKLGALRKAAHGAHSFEEFTVLWLDAELGT